MNKLMIAALGATLLTGAASAQDRPRMDPLQRADANHDGVVTKDEMLADVDARFNQVDTNHDGKISPEERQAFGEAMRARMEQRRAAEAATRGPGGPGGPGMGRRAMGGDMPITLEESRARALERFDRADTNHDGKIDQAERDAMRDRMMQMRGRGAGEGPPPPPPADAPNAPGGN